MSTPEDLEAVDVVALLEALDEPTCAYNSDGVGTLNGETTDTTCGVRADWLMVCSCGDTAYLCHPHAEGAKRHVRRLSGALFCANHGGLRVDVEWAKIP